ncbi:unnamed protein product, partial [Iphiclides podalirius]
MEQPKANTPKLFICTVIENKDEIEERYERAYVFLQSLVADCSEKEAHDALNNAVCKNHEDVSLGMLMSILTEPHNATKCYRDLTLITRDGLTGVQNNLSNLILESCEGASGIKEEGADDILPKGGLDEPAFSDDEEDSQPNLTEDTDDDDIPLSEVRARERPELAAALPIILRPYAEALLDERSTTATTAFINACGSPMPTASALADLFVAILQDAPALTINPNPTPSELETALDSPIFAMLDFLNGGGTEAKKKTVDNDDTFVVSTIMYWCQDFEDKVGDLLSVLLSTRYPGTSPNKRKRTGKHNIPPNAPPSAEQVLGHLEQIRVCCVEQDDMSIFKIECMQKALQHSQSNSSDGLRRQYSELFSLAWEDELPISRRARKLISNSLPLNQNLHSSNEDSEEEEIVKPKQAKRRKKAISDSE